MPREGDTVDKKDYYACIAFETEREPWHAIKEVGTLMWNREGESTVGVKVEKLDPPEVWECHPESIQIEVWHLCS